MGLDNRTYIHGQGFHSMSTVSKERWEEIFGRFPKTMKRLAESEKAEKPLSSKEKLGVKR